MSVSSVKTSEPHLHIEDVHLHRDSRGTLWKAFPFPITGEVYAVSITEGQSRGHHLHRATAEWFTGITGAATLLVAAQPNGPVQALELLGRRVRVPAGWPHAILAPPEEPVLVLVAMERAHDPTDVVPCLLEAP